MTKTNAIRKRKTSSNSTFQRGSGQYTCILCGKQTRETGSGESQSKMCRLCWDKAGDDNAVADGHMSEAEFFARYGEHSTWVKRAEVDVEPTPAPAAGPAIVELPDELNPIGIFAMTSTKLLVDAVAGRINLQELAILQLSNRGLNQDGEWVGFREAGSEAISAIGALRSPQVVDTSHGPCECDHTFTDHEHNDLSGRVECTECGCDEFEEVAQ